MTWTVAPADATTVTVPGSVNVRVTSAAALGPRLPKVTVTVASSPALTTLVIVTLVFTSATPPTPVATVTVLLGCGSGVVLVPAAVLVTVPVVALTVAWITMVSVWPTCSVVVAAALVLAFTSVTTPLFVDGVPTRPKPALKMSVNVTFCAALGPRLTKATV